MRRSIAALSACIGLAACATIMHGTGQDIGFNSSPTNAKVMVDGQPRGNTPVIVKLSRKDNHVVRMELEGYQPFEATLTHGVSGWVWGNLVFGGLPGLAVDAISGGLYAINANQVTGTMVPAAAGASQQGEPATKKPPQDAFFITVVPHADPSWKRLGTLTSIR